MGLWIITTQSKKLVFAQHLEKYDSLRMLPYSSLLKVCKYTAKIKTQPNLYIFDKWEIRHLYYFWGYGWERIENISAEKAQKHLSNFERNEDVIRGLFVLPPAIPAEHKGTAQNCSVKEDGLGLSALFLSGIYSHLSQFISLPSTSLML